MTAARLYASNAAVWVRCPGSVRLSAPAPRTRTDAAEEGTAAHTVAERMLRAVPTALGERMPNGIAVTEEMTEGAELYAATIAERIPAAHRVIEQTLRAPSISEHMAPMKVDAAGLDAHGTTLHVIEYKFGHAFVDAFENWQLVCYAVALWEWYESAGILTREHEATVELCLTVVQPRSYHRDGPVRSWRTTMVALRAQVNMLANAAANALSATPRFKPGDHCAKCDARAACETLQRAAYVAADEAGNPTPFDLPPHALGHELKWLHAAKRLLDARVEALEQEAEERLRAGADVPHYVIEHDPGRLVWLDDAAETATAMAEVFGVALTKRPELITPTQAIKAGVPAEVVQSLAVRRGKSKLSPFDTNKTRRIFGDTKP